MNSTNNSEVLQLPDIVQLSEYQGNFQSFYEAVYQIFVMDFVDSQPRFEGIKLGLKKHPKIDGKEYTFYHFTHDGSDEENRIPNLRRMERMPWPAPIINQSSHQGLKVWRNNRGKHERILILYEQEKYLIILEDRKDYIIPWTAYLVDYPNKMRKLLGEYQAFKSQNRPAD